MSYRHHSDVERQYARRLRARGWSHGQIAKEIGCGERTVQRWLNPNLARKDTEAAYHARKQNGSRCIDCGTPTSYPPTIKGRRCNRCSVQHRVPWNKQTIIQAIQRWAQQHGHPPRSREWQPATPGYPSATTMIRLFGSFSNAIEAAGYRPYRGASKVPLDERLARELRNQGLTEQQVSDKLKVSTTTLRRRLGLREKPVKRYRTRAERIADLNKALQ